MSKPDLNKLNLLEYIDELIDCLEKADSEVEATKVILWGKIFTIGDAKTNIGKYYISRKGNDHTDS